MTRVSADTRRLFAATAAALCLHAAVFFAIERFDDAAGAAARTPTRTISVGLTALRPRSDQGGAEAQETTAPQIPDRGRESAEERSGVQTPTARIDPPQPAAAQPAAAQTVGTQPTAPQTEARESAEERSGATRGEEPMAVSNEDASGSVSGEDPPGASPETPPRASAAAPAAAPPAPTASGAGTADSASQQPGAAGGTPPPTERTPQPTRRTPQPTRRTPPRYPERARRAGVEGTVVVTFEIGADGRPLRRSLEVRESSGSAILDREALRAVRSWRFSESDRGVTTVQQIVFRLEDT